MVFSIDPNVKGAISESFDKSHLSESFDVAAGCKRARTCHPATSCIRGQDPTTAPHVRDRIFNLSPIHVSVFYQVSWIQWIPVPFIKTFCAILSYCIYLHSFIFGFRLSDGLTKWSCFALVSLLSPTVSLQVLVTSCAGVPLVGEVNVTWSQHSGGSRISQRGSLPYGGLLFGTMFAENCIKMILKNGLRGGERPSPLQQYLVSLTNRKINSCNCTVNFSKSWPRSPSTSPRPVKFYMNYWSES